MPDRYTITSNRESGFGRYDVMLEPKTEKDDAIIMEFKVHRPKKERDMEDTVKAVLQQIEENSMLPHLKQKALSQNGFGSMVLRLKGKMY